MGRAALYKASTDHVPYLLVMLSAAPRFHGRPREPEARSRNTPRMCPASMPLPGIRSMPPRANPPVLRNSFHDSFFSIGWKTSWWKPNL